MSEYRVTWIIDIAGSNPKDAVSEAMKWMKRDDCNWSYTVEDMKTGEIIAIDTEELETEE